MLIVSRTLWFFCLTASMAQPALFESAASLKLAQYPRFTFYFNGRARELVDPAAKALDQALDDFERRWSVILPDERIPVALMVGGESTRALELLAPDIPWLRGGYNLGASRIELYIRDEEDFRSDVLTARAPMLLVRHFLARSNEHIPAVLGEGLIRRYGLSRPGQDRLTAIWAFQRHDDIAALLKEDASFSDERRDDVKALAHDFVAWLWREFPEAERPVMQGLLLGENYEPVLIEQGMVSLEILVDRYVAEMAKDRRLSAVLGTYDFWVICFGVMVLIGMVVALVRAGLETRYTHVEETFEALVSEDMFEGPVFAGQSEVLPDPRPVVETPKPAANPVAVPMDFDLDQAFASMLDGVGSKETPVASRSRQETESVDEGALEDDLDRLFDDWDDQGPLRGDSATKKR